MFTYSIFAIIFNNLMYGSLWLLYKFNLKTHRYDHLNQPSVSVLVAVRNEAEHIENLISDLENQNYPNSKIQILIGNDDSDDNSLELLNQLSSETIRVVDIKEQLKGLNGKMNVLAQLAKLATGDYLLLTDADVRINSNWIAAMVSSTKQNVGIVGGFTRIRARGTFEALQNVDMHFGQGMLKVLNDLGVSVSVIGNNMLFDRKKFEDMGGYGNMKFSLVEDVALMQEFLKNGHEVYLSYTKDTCLQTFGETNWSKLMAQRARWTEAFYTVPIWLKLLMVVKFSFLPAVLYLLQFNLWFALFFLTKVGLSLLFFMEIGKSMKIRSPLVVVFLFEFFEPVVYLSTLIYGVLPFKLKWKGREY